MHTKHLLGLNPTEYMRSKGMGGPIQCCVQQMLYAACRRHDLNEYTFQSRTPAICCGPKNNGKGRGSCSCAGWSVLRAKGFGGVCGRGGEGVPMKAEYVCPLGCMHWFWVVRRNWSTLPVPGHWGKALSIGESGTVVPLLTSAASAAWRPSHGTAPHKVFPNTVKVGGC